MTRAITLQTKLGAITVEPTQASHIYVRGEPLVVRNGTPIFATAHLYRRADKTFRIGPYPQYGIDFEVVDQAAYDADAEKQWAHRQENHGALYTKKQGPNFDEAAPSFRKAIAAEIERVVNEWAVTDSGKAAIREGEIEYRNRVAEIAEGKYAAAVQAADEAKAARERAYAAKEALWEHSADLEAPYVAEG